MSVNVLGAVADFLIALILVFYLRRSRTGFKRLVPASPDIIVLNLGYRSDHMITKLIFFSVSTGLLTSVCAIASLVSILLWGNTLCVPLGRGFTFTSDLIVCRIYVAFYFSLGRCTSLQCFISATSDQIVV